MINLLGNVSNLLIINLFVIIAIKLNHFPLKAGILLFITNLSPLLINGPIIDITYMPDQNHYFHSVSSLRDFAFTYLEKEPPKIVYTAYIYSLLPLPFVMNVVSIAFFNKIIFSWMIIWLFRNKVINSFMAILIILFPSMILYSSLALREIMILAFMLISGVYLVQRKLILYALFSLPLFFIKIQNFYLLSLVSLLHVLLFSSYSYKRLLVPIYFIIGFFFVYLFIDDFINLVNFYGEAFAIESSQIYKQLEGVEELFFKYLSHTGVFIIRPLISDFSLNFTLFSFIEGIAVLFFIIYIVLKFYKSSKSRLFFWICSFSAIGGLHSMILFNDGTFVRYKFTFVVYFIVIMLYDIKFNKDLIDKSKPLNSAEIEVSN